MITQEAPVFDSEKYKNTTRQQWDAAAAAWDRWGPFLRKWLGEATELMLDLAGVQAGSRVLDVAAGAGDQTLQAAARVGPRGHVLATDISPRILELAALHAQEAGYGQVQTAVQDGENLDVPEASFDAVISRVGLIYFPDQQRALRAMKRALKPGGRIAAIVYSTPERNGFFSIPVSIIRARAALPAPLPGQPGPFSLGSAGVLEETFKKAGFVNVASRVVAAPVRLASAAECVRFEQESFGALHQMLSTLDADGKAAAWEEILTRFAQFERDGRFEGPCELVVGVGTRG
ncbi:Metalloid methyltransferase [Burkholderiales bacterium]|nr:Metalloid methyltransferase [Burkholderiales bacterium]